MNQSYIVGLFFLAIISIGNALECHVCTEQPGNVAKCLNSIATCDQPASNDTDAVKQVCMTHVRWGSAPYWTSGGQKQFYISKRCATKNDCMKLKRKHMKDCTYLWYQDWQCYDCCVGDRCNYYIFSGSDKQVTSFYALFVALLATMLFSRTAQ